MDGSIVHFAKEPVLNLTEAQTRYFYLWEKSGRGWEIWNYPVELEPAYQPFYHYFPQKKHIDDGRRHTFFSSLIEKLKGKPPQISGDTPSLPENPFDVLQSEFVDDSCLRQIKITLPPHQKISIEHSEQFLLSLSFCSFPVSFEIIGSSDSITVQVVCRYSDFFLIKQQFHAYFPDAITSEDVDSLSELWEDGKDTIVVDFGLSQEFMRPLRAVRNLELDPLTGIAGALENLDKNEIGMFQVLFQAVRHPWAESIIRSVTDGEGKSFFADAPEMAHLAKEKVRRPLFAACIRAVGQSHSINRAWEITRGLASGLTQTANPESNELIPLSNDDYDDYVHKEDALSRRTHRKGMIVNSEELASLVHPPSVSVRAKKLVRELKKTKAAGDITAGHRLILGENVHQGKTTVVTVSPEQRLRHMHIIGATGTGKSTLFLNLIAQDIENNLGVAVLDPHGDLIERILGYIPEERFNDVILIDPSDADFPVGLNILTAYSEIEKNLLSSDLVSVFRRLSTTWGDQMTSVLGNAILALLESESGGTLIDLRRFLIEPDFRKRFLETVKDPAVVYYWHKEFPIVTGKSLGPILTRLDTFLRPKLIRNMVAQKQGLNFEEIINTKKIFLAKLSQGLVGEENAYLLGTFIVSKIHQAAMARQARSVSERESFFLYIDEFHNFITPSMAALLGGVRKYHLGLILAHQELRQLMSRDSEVGNSVISNPGTRICFRLGDFDAQKLAEGFSFFEAKDLQNLGIGEAVCRIERPDHDFNLKVFAPSDIDPELAEKRRAKLIELSRQRYGRPKEEIEEILLKEQKSVSRPNIAPPSFKEVKEPEPAIEPSISRKEKKPKEDVSALEGKGGPQHKYLQSLVKRMAEERGFRAIIEEPTPDGQGSVDVGLEREGKRIACEISLTSTGVQELANIEKCLKSGYERVILCSPQAKNIEKAKTLALQKFSEADYSKILFFSPEELYFHLEEEAASHAVTEEKIKGFKVKVHYQPVKETEKKTKREAVAKVILSALRRLKGGK